MPYAACMDELLGRRVPITLAALAALWGPISAESARLRYTVPEELSLIPI